MKKRTLGTISYWVEMDPSFGWWAKARVEDRYPTYSHRCFCSWGALWKAWRMAHRIAAAECFNRE